MISFLSEIKVYARIPFPPAPAPPYHLPNPPPPPLPLAAALNEKKGLFQGGGERRKEGGTTVSGIPPPSAAPHQEEQQLQEEEAPFHSTHTLQSHIRYHENESLQEGGGSRLNLKKWVFLDMEGELWKWTNYWNGN